MFRSTRRTPLLVAGIFVFTGCGGDDAGGGSTPDGDSGTGADTASPDAPTKDTASSDTLATDSSVTDTAASDTTASDTTASDTPTDVAVACTPTATIRLTLNAYGGTLPVTATATPSVCSTGPITVGAKKTDFAVPVGVPVFFTADGGSAYWPSGSVEWNRPAGSSGDEALDVISKTQIPLPDYDATKAHLFVQLNAPSTATTCDASGWVVSVPGHPEATIGYTKSGGFTIDSTLTATAGTRGGNVLVQKIDPGVPVTVVATKTGCAVDFKLTPVFTGNVPLVAGTIVHTVGNLAVKP